MPKKIKKTKKANKRVVKKIKVPKKKAIKKPKVLKKKPVRKIGKKAIKRTSKKIVSKRKAKKGISLAKAAVSGGKPIGIVTHFYDGLGVAIVKFSKAMAIGTPLKFKGATTEFEDKIISMQFDRKPITLARKNLEVGIKVKDKVREGDKVFEV